MGKFSNVIKAFKLVFSNINYWFIMLFVTFVLLLFNLSIINYDILSGKPNLGQVIHYFVNTFMILPYQTLVMIVFLPLLSGIFIAMLIYHIKEMSKHNHSYKTGMGGLILGTLAPSCSACGVGLISLLGIGGVVGSLPFHGIEIGIIGGLLLIFSIYSTSQKITLKTCNSESLLKKLLNKVKLSK